MVLLPQAEQVDDDTNDDGLFRTVSEVWDRLRLGVFSVDRSRGRRFSGLGQIGAQWSCYFWMQDGVLATVDRHCISQKHERPGLVQVLLCVLWRFRLPGREAGHAERVEPDTFFFVVVSKFLPEVITVSRMLLRSGSIVSPARLSAAGAGHSWRAVNLKFRVDVVSECSSEITVAKKVRDTVQLVVASWINRVAHEMVFSLRKSQFEGGHPEFSCCCGLKSSLEMITVAKTLEERSLSLHRGSIVSPARVFSSCARVSSSFARGHTGIFHLTRSQRFLLEVITGCENSRAQQKIVVASWNKYCRQRDWNADTLGISCCRGLKDFAGGEHSLLLVF